ncbi:MAG: hypothetical protein AB7Q00_14275 [Phycisphaerales bacterium]
MSLASAAVHAGIIHFTNPAPGAPGHYDWYAAVSGDGLSLDIAAPPEGQTNAFNGSSLTQAFSGVPTGGTFSVLVGVAGAEFVSSDHEDSTFVTPLNAGEAFSSLDFNSGALIATIVYPEGQPTAGFSLFPESARRYVGVRTSDGRFGWIEVQRSGYSIAALSWAYETVPGVPINAGQIPAPGPPALLAIGVYWISLRRRLPHS